MDADGDGFGRSAMGVWDAWSADGSEVVVITGDSDTGPFDLIYVGSQSVSMETLSW